MRHITSLGILATIAATAASASADGDGTLATNYQAPVRGGGIIAVGDGTAGRVTSTPVPSTTLSFTLPVGTTAKRAWLYVNTIGTMADASLALDVDGTMVDAPLIGTHGATCWGSTNINRGYRGDLSEMITGSGSIVVTGYPSSTSAADDTQGVALIIVYEDPASNDGTMVTINDGMIATNTGANHSVSINNLNITQATTAARLVTVVGDGQQNTTSLTLNSQLVSSNAFPGALGPMFDVRDDDVFALLNVPVSMSAVSMTSSGDCLSWMVGAITYTFPDNDVDGIDDSVDDDDDNDGVLDNADGDPLDPAVCEDTDGDGCDDCAIGVDGFGPLDDFDPANDGIDTDGDGVCDDGDPDDDNDGVDDTEDSDPLDPGICEDADGDTCDDCSVGDDDFGPLPDNDPSNDGPDADGDGICDDGEGMGSGGGGGMMAGSGGATTGTGAGTGGSTSGAGGSGTGTGGNGIDDDGRGDDGAIEEASGCGCRIPAGPASPSSAWLLLAGLGLALRRRR